MNDEGNGMNEYRAIPWDHADVPVRGEQLGLELWRGRQWSVTTDGIERRDGTYFIAAKRLTEQESTYPWTRHMAENDWVDQADFGLAFRIALHLHHGRQAPAA